MSKKYFKLQWLLDLKNNELKNVESYLLNINSKIDEYVNQNNLLKNKIDNFNKNMLNIKDSTLIKIEYNKIKIFLDTINKNNIEIEKLENLKKQIEEKFINLKNEIKILEKMQKEAYSKYIKEKEKKQNLIISDIFNAKTLIEQLEMEG